MGHSPYFCGAPTSDLPRTFALKSEWQRQSDRNRIGANSRWFAPPLSEPAMEHGPGIVGDIGERSDAHPV